MLFLACKQGNQRRFISQEWLYAVVNIELLKDEEGTKYESKRIYERANLLMRFTLSCIRIFEKFVIRSPLKIGLQHILRIEIIDDLHCIISGIYKMK